MDYIAKIIFSAVVIALLVIGQRSKQNSNSKLLLFGLAGAVWVVGLWWLRVDWVGILISLAGVLLFAWLINMFIDDAKQIKKGKKR
jgi:hypothetical protein